jgi:hypothetical protein
MEHGYLQVSPATTSDFGLERPTLALDGYKEEDALNHARASPLLTRGKNLTSLQIPG